MCWAPEIAPQQLLVLFKRTDNSFGVVLISDDSWEPPVCTQTGGAKGYFRDRRKTLTRVDVVT